MRLFAARVHNFILPSASTRAISVRQFSVDDFRLPSRPYSHLQPILQFGFAFAPPLVIGAAVKNNVFGSLLGGAKTVEQVDSTTGAFVRGLRAIMNALVGFELLAKNGDKYSLVPESEAFLVGDKPVFTRWIFRNDRDPHFAALVTFGRGSQDRPPVPVN